MKKTGVKMVAPLLIIITALSISYPDDAQLIKKIIDTYDKLYKSSSSYALIEMQITTPHWQRTLKMKSWSLGMEKMLVKILAPKKERGVGTLKIDNEMWNFLPKTNKVIKIPPSMMMSSWMGSDFTNDDLVKEYTLADDYDISIITPDNAQEDCHYVKGIPKKGKAIVWGAIEIAVRKDDYIPLWEKYYDEHGTLVREMVFKKIKTIDNHTIPTVIELIPRTKEGHKTVLIYNDIDFDISPGKETFSLRKLREPVKGE